MREFIKEQLKEKGVASATPASKEQINEFNLPFIMSKVKDFVNTKDKTVNKKFAKIIADKFEGEFGEFLRKDLIKKGKSLNTMDIVQKYLVDPDKHYDALFELIGLPMLDFFVKKTFGKASIGGKVRQITPFMKKVSTGNSKLDKYVFQGIQQAFKDEDIRALFKKKLTQTLSDKLHDVQNDKDYWELISDLVKDSKVNESAQINEIKAVDNLKDKAKKIRNLFISREKRNRYKILDNILDTVPNLKRPIKRKIRDKVFKDDYYSMDSLVDGVSPEEALDYVIEPIMEHIAASSQGIYFKLESFKDFVEIVKNVFTNEKVKDTVRHNILTYLTIEMRATKEREYKRDIKDRQEWNRQRAKQNYQKRKKYKKYKK